MNSAAVARTTSHVRNRIPRPAAAHRAPAQRALPGVRSLDSRRPDRRRSWITWTSLLYLAATLLVAVGYHAPTQRYLTPETGLGYALGILGGSLMLLLLVYPARKRIRWLSFIGSVKAWFQWHMALGIAAPILILYHSNFSLGATNSNVALISMLTVAGSGLIGRYFYTRIHDGLYGHEATLKELQTSANRLRSGAVSISVPFLPELLERIDVEEQSLLVAVARGTSLVRPLISAWRGRQARSRLRRYVRQTLRREAKRSRTVASHKRRLQATARGYIDTRLKATRRVAEYQAYAQLFSLWHLLHLPLFFLLLIAGAVHVIAVHVY